MDPGTLGYYAGGKHVTPRHPLRTREALQTTEWLDKQLMHIADAPPANIISTERLIELIEKIAVDYEPRLWNLEAIKSALSVINSRAQKEKSKQHLAGKAYLVVKRKRDLEAARNEGQTIYSSPEADLAPTDAPTLFMFRANATARGEVAAWWPEIRFPAGNYVLAFSFNW